MSLRPLDDATRARMAEAASWAQQRKAAAERERQEEEGRAAYVAQRSREISASGRLPGEAWAKACEEWDSAHEGRRAA